MGWEDLTQAAMAMVTFWLLPQLINYLPSSDFKMNDERELSFQEVWKEVDPIPFILDLDLHSFNKVVQVNHNKIDLGIDRIAVANCLFYQ